MLTFGELVKLYGHSSYYFYNFSVSRKLHQDKFKNFNYKNLKKKFLLDKNNKVWDLNRVYYVRDRWENLQ